MAKAVTCHYYKAAILHHNTLYKGDIERKYDAFRELFPNTFTKETFRRNVKAITSFVDRKKVCRGKKRDEYIKKYGPKAWMSLALAERNKHTSNCKECQSDELMPEAIGHRPKKATPRVKEATINLLATPPCTMPTTAESNSTPKTPKTLKKTGIIIMYLIH